jgi:hypothetical protein
MTVSNITTLLQAKYAPHATASSLVPPLVASSDWTYKARKYVTAFCAVDATAATDLERSIFSATPNYTGGITVYGAWMLPDAAVTGDPTNNAILQLGYRPQAGGGSQTAIGSALTTTVSWVALSQVVLYSSAVGVAVPQNQVITLARTHGGTGVAIPNMRVMIEFAEV